VTRRNLGVLLRESAARVPDRDAVVLDGARTSYSALASQAARFARSLRSRGIMKGDRVGLWLPKSHAAIAALWGAMEAGAAYVPVDPGAPPARLATIARDAGLAALVVSPDRLSAANEGIQGLATLRGVWSTGDALGNDGGASVPTISWRELESESDAPLEDSPGPDGLAYVLYTSGSTGVPKGVVHTHASALAFAEWAAATFALTEADRVSNHAPFHFDLSTFDLFAAALAGAAVHPVPARATAFPAAIAKLYSESRLTVIYETPSALALLLRHGKLATHDLSALRVLLFAGEVMPVPLLRELMSLVPRARFANLYGPTETNVCTWHEVKSPPREDRALPIGVPCSGDDAWILDDELRPAPAGEIGELWISGDSLMRGYWNDAARTEQALRTLELGGRRVRAYRTGDRVRRDESGELMFHGRRDHQVKTRGYRVELAEIENALHAHPALAEAVVIAVPDPEIGNRLKALVVLKDGVGAAPPSAADLKDHCARTLPRYMVPELIEFRETLPRTSSGKVDRATLAAGEATVRKEQA
jgi:amino acid adenylation domain-containing protein